MAKENYQMGSVNLKARIGGPNNRAMEKPQDMKQVLRQMAAYCSRSLVLFAAALLCAVGGAGFTLAGPGRLSVITDLISEGIDSGNPDLPQILSIGLGLMVFYLISFALTYGETALMCLFAQRTARSLRSDISGKLGRIPLSEFDKASFGDLISRMTNDVDSLTEGIRVGVGDIVNAVVLFAGSVVLMLGTNVFLAVLAVGASLVGFALMTVITKRSQPYFTQTSDRLGYINGHIEEMVAGHQVVKSYNGEEDSARQFEEINRALYESVWKSQFLSGIMMPLMSFIGNLGYVAVCVAGAVLAAQGTITFGVIVAFIVYVKLFTQPMGMLAQAVTNLQTAAAAAERIFRFLAVDEMEDESGKIQCGREAAAAGNAARAAMQKPETAGDSEEHSSEPGSAEGSEALFSSQAEDAAAVPASFGHPTHGHVEFDHVRFGYTKERTILHDFCADILPGQQVAIVGPTGAGKTTLVNLLMRFYELDDGQIRIDGTDIRDMTREQVHDLFGMVLQDTWIFEDTIRANVGYCRPEVSGEQIEAACRAVGLHSYISSLPDGYDTVLKDDANLSAGQRQLLTIARAMVADKPLLILDEATSSVDTRTEQIVQDAMLRLSQGRTSFTIAHRLSTIRNADIILVMKDGDIEEKGTHEELLARGGFYAQLWNSQFEGVAI